MNSTLLISRIQRNFDTDGRCGDGAAVAADYVVAVNTVNRRLNTCMAYLAEAQQSEAIRIAEEHPALLDECATLSFVQLPAWQELCRQNGWPLAETINEYSIEKLNAVYASASALEPLLKLYRKAVRIQDLMLVIRCLRRIVSMDKANLTWRQDLAAFETRYLVSLKERFKQATASQDRESLSRIAEEVEAGGWIAPIDGALLVDISEYRKAERNEVWSVQFEEDMALLHNAFVARDLDKTKKFLSNVQNLEKKGFVVPVAARSMLDEVSKWGEDAEAKRTKNAIRKRLSADLHKAIELADEHQIRALLASPEFAECSPDEDLNRRARLVLQRADFKKAQKRTRICVLIAFALAGVAVAAGLKYRQHLHVVKRTAAIQRLELAYTQENEKALRSVLQEIKTQDAALYEDGLVKIWEQKLLDLSQQVSLKRQTFDRLAEELQAKADARFATVDRAWVTNKLEEGKRTLPKNDLARNAKLAQWVEAFYESCEKEEKDREQTAANKMEALLSRSADLQQRLKSEKQTEALKDSVAELKNSFVEWQNTYSNQFPVLEVRVQGSCAELTNAEQQAQSVVDQLARLGSAKSIQEWISTRDVLVKYCDVYPEIKPLLVLMKVPFKEAVDGSLNVFIQTATRAKKYAWTTEKEKLEKVLSDIKEYSDVDTETKMYGIYAQDATLKSSTVFSLKAPNVKPSTTGVGVEISGMLFQPGKNPDGFEDGKINTFKSVTYALMPHCKYFNQLIDKASETSVSALVMALFLLEKMQKIMDDTELTPYKRTQLLGVHFGYLLTLTEFTQDDELARMEKKLRQLSKPLPILRDAGISWLMNAQKDVQDREAECVEFIAKNRDMVEQIRKWLCVQAMSAVVARQQLVFAGSVKLDGTNPPHFVGTTASYNAVCALRMEDNCYKLRHVLQVTGDTVALASRDTVLLPGEPLFAFSSNSQISSLSEEIIKILHEYEMPLKNVKHRLPPSWPVGLEVKE